MVRFFVALVFAISVAGITDATSGEVALAGEGSSGRDVVFAIDISSSMGWHDPMHDGTCGRLTAFMEILHTLPDFDSRVGVFRFHERVVHYTPLYESKANLLHQLSARNALADVLCYVDPSSPTSYTPVFEAAGRSLGVDRPLATKEVILISDGGADDQSYASAIAASMRESLPVGVHRRPATFGVITLAEGPESDYLRDRIASRDANGVPVFGTIDQAGDVARMLQYMNE